MARGLRGGPSSRQSGDCQLRWHVFFEKVTEHVCHFRQKMAYHRAPFYHLFGNEVPKGELRSEGSSMRHVQEVIRELRRYIAAKPDRADLEEIDTLLAVALEEVRRKLAQKAPKGATS